jgi:protein ImuB
MFACLFVPPPAVRRGMPPAGSRSDGACLIDIARMVSPRVDARSGCQVVIDVQGLERLVGDPKAIGERLRQAAAGRGFAPVHVALAGTRTAAMLLAAARAGVTVVPAGGEADALAPLPLRTLAVLASEGIEVRRQKTEDRRQKAGGERREARGGKPEFRSELAPSRAPNPESRLPRRSPEESGRAKAGVPSPHPLAVLARWGLRTLGELAALPAAELSERLGQDGVRWQRLARGEDTGPLVPAPVDEPFEASLELEWPIDGLEPLSFVLSRLLDPLCQRLERRDRGVAVLHVRLRLVTRALHIRSLQLPAPMRDPKVLRTLLLLDLESHPAPAGIDAVTVAIDPTPGRIVQESLLTRALPAPEQISTLVARLQALMGDGRCGSPALVDSHRPGAFAMKPFRVDHDQKTEDRRQNQEARNKKPEDGLLNSGPSRLAPLASRPEPRVPSSESRELAPNAQPLAPSACLRRFRLPIPARVLMDGGRPLSVRTDRQALPGGHVHASAGPWRTSGEWWKTAAGAGATEQASRPGRAGWHRDEWDVALGDGGVYRIFEDRDSGRWFVEAVVD